METNGNIVCKSDISAFLNRRATYTDSYKTNTNLTEK